jgi:hypothetical protein
VPPPPTAPAQRGTRLLNWINNWINWSAFFSLAVAALVVALAYRSPM